MTLGDHKATEDKRARIAYQIYSVAGGLGLLATAFAGSREILRWIGGALLALAMAGLVYSAYRARKQREQGTEGGA